MKNNNAAIFKSIFQFVVVLLVVIFIVSGCSTAVPVTAKFPDVPERLLVQCPQLEKLSDGAKLSDVANTVTINYSTYYDCAVKNDAWIEWYQIQRNIFNGAAK
jgi:hypothetical protein